MNTGSAISGTDTIAVSEAMYRAMYGNSLIDLLVMIASYSLIFGLVHLARRRSDAMFAPLYNLAGLFLIAALIAQLVAFYFYVNQAYTTSIVIKAVAGTLAVMSAVMVWPIFSKLRMMTVEPEQTAGEPGTAAETAAHSAEKRFDDATLAAGVTNAEREALKMTIDISERRYEQLLGMLERAVFRNQAMSEQQIAAILGSAPLASTSTVSGAPASDGAQAASVTATDQRFDAAQSESDKPVTDAETTSLRDVIAQRENERMQTWAKHASVIIWSTNDKAEFVERQPSWESFTGQSWEQYRGYGWRDALHPDDIKQSVANWQRALTHDGFVEFDGRVWHQAKQDWVRCACRAVPIYDSEGRVREWVGATEDVTERQRLDAQFRAALEQAPTALLIVDQHGAIESVNKETLRLFGYREEDLLGRSISCLLPDDDNQQRQSLLNHLHDNTTRTVLGDDGGWMAKGRDGRIFPVQWGLNPVIEQASDTKICNVIDLTEYKVREEALLQEKAQLEASNRELEAFTYVASHDLKEPIRKIGAFGDLLRQQAESKLSEQELDFLQRMIRASHRMSTMIDDLLFYSQMSHTEAQRSRVDLGDIVDSILIDYEYELKEHHFEVRREPLPQIWSVKSQVLQLMTNLISNAIKFSKDQSKPSLTIGSLNPGDRNDQLGVYVRDNGIGIESGDQTRIFGVFERANAKNRYEGNGIGLAICRKIIEQHGGKIEVYSEPGQGSEFRIWFPKVTEAVE